MRECNKVGSSVKINTARQAADAQIIHRTCKIYTVYSNRDETRQGQDYLREDEAVVPMKRCYRLDVVSDRRRPVATLPDLERTFARSSIWRFHSPFSVKK